MVVLLVLPAEVGPEGGVVAPAMVVIVMWELLKEEPGNTKLHGLWRKFINAGISNQFSVVLV